MKLRFFNSPLFTLIFNSILTPFIFLFLFFLNHSFLGDFTPKYSKNPLFHQNSLPLKHLTHYFLHTHSLQSHSLKTSIKPPTHLILTPLLLPLNPHHTILSPLNILTFFNFLFHALYYCLPFFYCFIFHAFTLYLVTYF